MYPPWRRRRRRTARVVVLMLVVTSGCSTYSPPPRFVHDGPRGAVSLETLPPGSLQATQPTDLHESTVARVLSGIMVQAQQRLLQDILVGEAPARRAFLQDDVAFLSPLVREALRRAGPDDLVHFQARRATDSGQETTGGALYVKDGAVVLALTQYRARSARPLRTGKVLGKAPEAAGLRQHTITFLPRGVEVPLPSDPPDELAGGEFRLLAIDYALLARLQGLGSASPPESPGGDSVSERANKDQVRTELGALKDLIIQKDLEIEALRQEVESLRRQLEQTRSGRGP